MTTKIPKLPFFLLGDLLFQVYLSCVCSCYTELDLQHSERGLSPSDWMQNYRFIASDNPSLIFMLILNLGASHPREKVFSTVLTQSATKSMGNNSEDRKTPAARVPPRLLSCRGRRSCSGRDASVPSSGRAARCSRARDGCGCGCGGGVPWQAGACRGAGRHKEEGSRAEGGRC